MQKGQRLENAVTLLNDAKHKVETLTHERDYFAKQCKSLRSVFVSRLQQQRFDLYNSKRLYSQFEQQFQQQVSDLGTSFKKYDTECKKLDEKRKYNAKLLRDQLNVKRLKYNELNRKVHELTAENVKRAKEAEHGAITKCLHCKARKKIAEKLTNDLANERAQREMIQSTASKVTAENGRLKETISYQGRVIIEVKAKLQDEVNKNTIKSSISNNNTTAIASVVNSNNHNLAASASSSDCQIVDISKTPVSNSSLGGSSPPVFSFSAAANTFGSSKPFATFAADHSLCEREANRLNWLVTNKSAEIARVQQQLTEFKDKCQLKEDQLLDLHTEYRSKSEELEIYKIKCQRLAALADQVEEKEVKLAEALERHNTVEQELQETKRKNDLLQTLLSNLATSVQSMLT